MLSRQCTLLDLGIHFDVIRRSERSYGQGY
jgi:hypothetical protein